ncbi:hypothetical protein FH972_005382 [Carpinus fangiana]|uniref:Uncharacterized protein n=1 Tax=Carpinus fangiana TaxID=176857 RepID=A0A5N6QQW7_9ROSI|nr:hypothetical protein FH972_005382 [Carpinus fangiana]
MGIRESIKGRCYRGNTDSDHSSSQQLENSPAITPASEEAIVRPSEKTRLCRLDFGTTTWASANLSRVNLIGTTPIQATPVPSSLKTPLQPLLPPTKNPSLALPKRQLHF